jgi:hypothetical protein
MPSVSASHRTSGPSPSTSASAREALRLWKSRRGRLAAPCRDASVKAPASQHMTSLSSRPAVAVPGRHAANAPAPSGATSAGSLRRCAPVAPRRAQLRQREPKMAGTEPHRRAHDPSAAAIAPPRARQKLPTRLPGLNTARARSPVPTNWEVDEAVVADPSLPAITATRRAE